MTTEPMRILPVIDLMNGQVVRGVAGRRAEYSPVVSQLTSSTLPLDVARAFRDHFGFDKIYLADLDAIGGRPPALPCYEVLQGDGFRLWVDAGIRVADDAKPLLAQGVASIIVGLETISGPAQLEEVLRLVSPARLVFSLDLKGGEPLTAQAGWPTRDPLAIAAQVVVMGVRRMLVLDLAQVGVGAGVGTEALCRRLREQFPALEIVAGGGVRDDRDVKVMECAGVNWLLIASALHDGRLTPAACGVAD